MKKREGFVSNSSSSSFIVKKDDLNERQEKELRLLAADNSEAWARVYWWADLMDGYGVDSDDRWAGTETEDEFQFSTEMNNISFGEYAASVLRVDGETHSS